MLYAGDEYAGDEVTSGLYDDDEREDIIDYLTENSPFTIDELEFADNDTLYSLAEEYGYFED